MRRSVWLLLTLLALSVIAWAAPKQAPVPAPGLGAFTAPVKFTVVVSGVTYEFSSPAITFTPVGSETKRALSGTGLFLPVGVVPIPPPTPTLSSITFPATVAASAQANGLVTISAAGTAECIVMLSSSSPLLVLPPSVTVTAGSRTASFAATTGATLTNQSATITAQMLGQSVTANTQITGSLPEPEPIPPPVPTPGPEPPKPTTVLNVRDFGAKGDGVANDRPAIQLAVTTAVIGQAIYFPAGRYVINDAIKFNRKSGVGVIGDPSLVSGKPSPSVLVHGKYTGLQLGTGGEASTGHYVRNMSFEGIIGRWMKDGDHGGDSIQIFGPKGTIIQDCYFRSPARAVDCVGPVGSTYGTVIRRIQCDGWAINALFCNGGETITDVDLIQDDPDLRGERSSHGFYVHSGASNVTMDGIRISNARKYSGQCYGEDANSYTDNLVLRNITIKNCANGLIISAAQLSAARPRNLLIDGVLAENVYDSSGAIVVHTVDGGTIKNITVRGVTRGTGIKLGDWPPYLPGMNLKDLVVNNVTVTGAAKGAVWVHGVNGGTFSGVVLSGISGTVIREGNTSGVTVIPSAPVVIKKRGN
jgi:hypothetical protein